MLLKNSYLQQVKNRNKPLYIVICVFIVLTLFTNFTRNEITPFFTWSMYSVPMAQADTFPIYTLEYNNGQIYKAPHTWKDHNRMMFFYTIDHYKSIVDNGGKEQDEVKMAHTFEKVHADTTVLSKLYTTPSQLDEYPKWLKRYMQANTGIKMDSIKVYRKWIQFNSEGHAQEMSSDLLFKI